METIRNDFEWIDLAGPVLAEALHGLDWLAWPALLWELSLSMEY